MTKCVQDINTKTLETMLKGKEKEGLSKWSDIVMSQ